MNGKIPHVVQYQGSKRMLAPEILGFMPKAFDRLVEPFSGMAAISIAVASENRAKNFWINDINQPLIGLLNQVVNEPEKIIENYSKIWNEQFIFSGGHIAHFYFIRDLFNSGDESPEHMLYLLARCVKGAVRYGKDGKFNQSPDKRRHGTTPNNLAKNVLAISSLVDVEKN